MLDIRLIRENPDLVRQKLASRGGTLAVHVDEVLEYDRNRRELETRLQELNAARKRLSKEIGMRRSKGEASEDLEAEVRGIGDEIATVNAGVAQAEEQQRTLLLQLPNLPDARVPLGADASENPIVRIHGEAKTFSFQPLDHIALAAKHQLFDPERATKISGSGFVCFTGSGARLERALINFCLNLHTGQHGYTEVSPPFIIRRDAMIGTGQIPKFEDDMYGLEEGQLFLAPTAEVSVTNLHREEILAPSELPKRLAAYAPCFRREAGSAGRDNRGIIRVHQFDKVELVNIVEPEQSWDALEAMTASAERVLQALGLHYRVIALCTGDMGFSSAFTYDIEVWAPGQGAYLEVSSCSNCTDFQARRMNLRYKAEDGKNRFVHTLNGSGTAMPRLFVALIETWQQEDGSIRIPEVLVPYFGAEEIR